MATKTQLQAKAETVCKLLKKRYGHIDGFLHHSNVFELLCAVCLSAQCTDERVNMTTPVLFAKYPNPEKLAAAKQADVERIIKSCGFYKNKARNLILMAQRLVSHHNSEVPRTIEEMTKLAGVGRKTANVVLGQYFGASAGVVVDTHVKRITNLLGLTKASDPEKIEIELNKVVPTKYWDQFSLWLISLGRETCVARRPSCEDCLLRTNCSYAQG